MKLIIFSINKFKKKHLCIRDSLYFHVTRPNNTISLLTLGKFKIVQTASWIDLLKMNHTIITENFENNITEKRKKSFSFVINAIQKQEKDYDKVLKDAILIVDNNYTTFTNINNCWNRAKVINKNLVTIFDSQSASEYVEIK